MGTLWLHFFSSVVVCASVSSSRNHEDFLKNVQCQLSVKDWIHTLHVDSHWYRKVDPVPGGKSYRAPTGTFGSWVELHISPRNEVEGVLLSPLGVESVVWGKECKSETKFSKKTKLNKNDFTDEDLAHLLKENKKGMIYIWSPGMVYSMDFYPTFKAMAKKLNLSFTVLMDPYFDEEQGRKKAKEFNIPFMNRRVESVELLMRDIGTHYPETLIYQNGKLSYERIVGAMTPEVLENEVTTSLKQLQ